MAPQAFHALCSGATLSIGRSCAMRRLRLRRDRYAQRLARCLRGVADTLRSLAAPVRGTRAAVGMLCRQCRMMCRHLGAASRALSPCGRRPTRPGLRWRRPGSGSPVLDNVQSSPRSRAWCLRAAASCAVTGSPAPVSTISGTRMYINSCAEFAKPKATAGTLHPHPDRAEGARANEKAP